MNSTAIYSKTGKGVQEASGKTSQLSRGDRAILSAIDGKINLKDLSARFDRALDDNFVALIRKMDAEGFIREASPGVAQRGAANAPRPAPSMPSTPPPASGGRDELDFTNIFATPAKVAPPPADPMAAARHEAEIKARQKREAEARAAAQAKGLSDGAQKERLDAEARAKAAREVAMQAAAEGKPKAEIEARTRAEAEARAREARAKVDAVEYARLSPGERAQREAENLRGKVEEERRAREEAERRARDEAERTNLEAEQRARREAEERARRETEERARRESELLRHKLEEERKAREEAERRAREEREKRERERALEDAERRAREEVERKVREERDRREQEENQRQIRLAREAEDRKRRDADARKRKEEEARRWEQEDARRKGDDGYRVRAEQEDKARAEREAVEAVERAEAEKKAAAAADALSGSLMADLDSFSKREEQERKEREEDERKQRAELQRKVKEEEALHEREEAERRARKEEDKRRRVEEEHLAKLEKERLEREAEEKKKEAAAEKKKKEREAEARKAASGDIAISSADLGRDDISDDERKLTPEARKALRNREREVARTRSRGDQPSAKAASEYKRKQPATWGKPVAVTLFLLLAVAFGVVNLLPLSTGEYEKQATDAIGHPVKIGAARMWVLAGVQVRLERVSIGETIRIVEVRAVPELGSLLTENKAFSRIEVNKVTLPQEALGNALFGSMKGDRLRVGRVVAKEVRLEGPLALPVLDADAQIASDGRVSSLQLSGERISGRITRSGDGVAFEATLGEFTLPFVENLSIADFGMKGSANRQGMTLSEFDGRLNAGTVVGKARIQWGAQWTMQGEIQGRSMNAGVFSPQMVSEGRFDGKGRFTLAGPGPAKLAEGAQLDGSFTVTKGALGSFDLSRALQSTSAQASGRTQFAELQGSVALANGTLALHDLKLSSGLLTASATLNVDAAGGLQGRINAELRNLRGSFFIGGKLRDPQLRR